MHKLSWQQLYLEECLITKREKPSQSRRKIYHQPPLCCQPPSAHGLVIFKLMSPAKLQNFIITGIEPETHSQ